MKHILYSRAEARELLELLRSEDYMYWKISTLKEFLVAFILEKTRNRGLRDDVRHIDDSFCRMMFYTPLDEMPLRAFDSLPKLHTVLNNHDEVYTSYVLLTIAKWRLSIGK